MIKEIELLDQDQSNAFAKHIAMNVRKGDTLALSGPLGAGKTFFTRAFCAALDSRDIVSSPSYVIMHEYGEDIVHIDLYRLESEEEVWELGLHEIFGRKIVIIEWPQLAESVLPENTLKLRFEYCNQHRKVTLEGNQSWIDSIHLNQALHESE